MFYKHVETDFHWGNEYSGDRGFYVSVPNFSADGDLEIEWNTRFFSLAIYLYN